MKEPELKSLKKKKNDPQISLNPSLKLSSNIPLDLILSDILPKLPAKSLIRFKCVSKSWLSVISSPKFAKLHLQHSLSKPHNHGALIQTRSSLYAVPNYSSFEYGPERFDLDLVKVKLGHHGIDESFDVLGSCNGLVFLRLQSGDLILWNSFTRECRDIPGYQSECEFLLSFWAFWYVPSLDDYKIVVFSRFRECGYDVFSLRSNDWRNYQVDDLFQDYQPQPSCKIGLVLPNAKAHWLLSKYSAQTGFSNLKVLVFDLVTETFSGIRVLDETNDAGASCFCQYACIGIIEEDLCIASLDLSKCLQVWVLKRYGDGKLSWNKFLKISGTMSPSWSIQFCTSCSTEKGGKFLMNCYGNVWLFYWGEGDGVAQCVQFEDRFTLYMDQFIDTLVSPFLIENA